MRVTGWHRVLAALACAVAVTTSALGSGPGRRRTPASAGTAGGPRHAGDRVRAQARRGRQRAADGRTVRRLVAFGPRLTARPRTTRRPRGWPSAFREAGLEVTVREDSPRNWYQPVSWEIRADDEVAGAAASPSRRPGLVRARRRGRVRAPLARDGAGRGVSDFRQPDAGDRRPGARRCSFDGRASASGWPVREPAARDVDRSRSSPCRRARRRRCASSSPPAEGPRGVRPRGEDRATSARTLSWRRCPGATARSTSCSAPTATRTPAGPAPTTTRRASPSSSKSPARWRPP